MFLVESAGAILSPLPVPTEIVISDEFASPSFKTFRALSRPAPPSPPRLRRRVHRRGHVCRLNGLWLAFHRWSSGRRKSPAAIRTKPPAESRGHIPRRHNQSAAYPREPPP